MTKNEIIEALRTVLNSAGANDQVKVWMYRTFESNYPPDQPRPEDWGYEFTTGQVVFLGNDEPENNWSETPPAAGAPGYHFACQLVFLKSEAELGVDWQAYSGEIFRYNAATGSKTKRAG